MVNFDQRKIKYVEWSNIYMCEQRLDLLKWKF